MCGSLLSIAPPLNISSITVHIFPHHSQQFLISERVKAIRTGSLTYLHFFLGFEDPPFIISNTKNRVHSVKDLSLHIVQHAINVSWIFQVEYIGEESKTTFTISASLLLTSSASSLREKIWLVALLT